MGRENLFLNTAGDIGLLPRVLDAASRYEDAPSDETMENLAETQEMMPLFV